MRNLSPHRRFESVRPVSVRIGSFSRNRWPEDLPAECRRCGTAFAPGLNLDIGPGEVARSLKKTAILSAMPCWLGALFLPPKMDSNLAGTLLFLILFATPPILILISTRMPTQRRVHCIKCGWEKFYPLPSAPAADNLSDTP